MEIPPKTAPRIFLIDAYALIYRSYFAFISRPLTNSAGENTSAPFGFTNFLLDIREKFEPDYLAIVFDAGDSFREEVYAEYKATREKMPDDLRSSLDRIRDIVAAFHDPVVELDGYEADDVIGTLAVKAKKMGLEAVIVSGDKDFYQLVSPGVHLMNPGRGGSTGVAADWVTTENAHEKFGIPPSQVVDYLALVGDASDNVPGAPGVGPKTAVKLLQQHDSVEQLLEHAADLKPPRASKSLQENAEQIRISKQLVTIMTDLDVDLDPERLKVQEPDAAALRDIFVELGFRRLSERYAEVAAATGAVPAVEAVEVDQDFSVVDDVAGLAEVLSAVWSAGRCFLSARSTMEDPLRGDVLGVSLAVDATRAWYLPFGHHQPFTLTFEGEGPAEVRNLPPLDDPQMSGLRGLLEDPGIAKGGHDLKRVALVLSRGGVTLAGSAFDTMVASYVLDPGRREHGLGFLALEILGHNPVSWVDVIGSGRTKLPAIEAPLEGARDHLCGEATAACRLQETFSGQLADEGLTGLMDDLEMRLVPVLTRMELAGISIDAVFFEKMRAKLRGELDLIQEEIWKLAGGEFNVNSTQQLRHLLFEELGLPVIKKTKTGASTDASVLEELAAAGHEIPRLLMEYRELEKLRNTYVEALPGLVNERTGRIHTSFNQAVAATGRLSSSDPNLQNIPIRTPLGREIRKGFVAAPDKVFLGADYSQIELRVLAHYSGDEAFVTAFTQGVDVHRQTASVIFGVSVDDVTPAMRGQAKTVNFATIYGQGAFSLAKQLGITREEAGQFIDTYFERFAGVRDFLDEQVELARELGYVETLLGRRRYVPELRAGNWNIRQFGERVAQNTPIQGTAADLMKLAMIQVQGALDETDHDARILLQVHDELLLEVAEGEVEPVRELVVSRMESAMQLNVPLVADSGSGPNWFDCK